ncbi:bifunctional glutamate N-acetyltransferase/amino-acid acetyltransferase ArgJ [Phaeobacter sp. PT47_59]|uniref:bifunctional glutamate N-acetyltransferase/amino-acid acetyltransferase ArgJ n=1 Tax=Phaeobacter sp. PT47_59 TaxID=3029979 RepID=UPI00238045CB|nr:bifunctional glutamate N-acetyltransferase/amino-acid acetyltransferase ArgJ [Phaeobacter sp. PT47_59]MDE4172893.1 bifunctional glutamate N-acetyltransferase/amino-acid acetyltransferase ArgJ [Phaeobacter sp. PT47_59]
MAKSMPVSPLAPAAFPDLPLVKGVRFATAAAGVKYKDRTDVMLAVLDPGAAVAGVFTRSKTRSAPVRDCQAKLGGDTAGAAAILVNSGNSNAFTGHYGQTSVAEIVASVSKITGAPQSRVFTASTGVIGEPLPHERIVAKIAELNDGLDENAVERAAAAIMTTDTFAKGAGATVTINGKTVNIAGIAKGSGMIAPDMATMLVYIFTDAQVEQAALQAQLAEICNSSFNCITVDSDTSTSDSLMLCATGASGVDATGNAEFAQALEAVMMDLAHQVVRDGEGATKFVEIQITGAVSDAEAKVHGMAIANSPLVKTAIAGEDPNWGRVVMAIGKSGAEADRDRLSISFGDVLVAEKGWVASSYKEEDGAAQMKQDEITIKVDLGLGDGSATVWTCDLTHQYITINADYRS